MIYLFGLLQQMSSNEDYIITMKSYQMRIICMRYLCVFGVLVSLPPEATSNVLTYFSKVPPSVNYVQTGRTARFEWEIQSSLYNNRDTQFGSYSPTWYYNSASVSQTQIAYEWKRSTPPWKWTIAPNCPARYLNPTRVAKRSTANLVISNITLDDDGIYECTLDLRALGFPVTSSAKLIVTVSPQIQAPQPPRTKSIAEGQELNVICTAIGRPTPNITWVWNVDQVAKSTGTGSAALRIPHIRRNQNGTYECQARNNPNEKPVTAQTVVTVYYPPKSNVTLSNVTIVQGGTIVLSCTADGNPTPSISWTKDNGVIKAGHTVAGGTLRIPDAIKTDAGKYICTARNTYDSREHTHNSTAIVVVKYQPSIVHDKLKDQILNETDYLSITCDTNGYPPPTINWKTPSGSTYSGNVYSIPSVSRSDAGTYTCTASNGIGQEAVANIKITVQYEPSIDLSTSSLTSKSWVGNTIRLRCFSAGLPPPQISWNKPSNQQITTGVAIIPGGSEVTVLTTADQGDYGQYKCRATNILGSDEHLINVTQIFTPGRVNITISQIEASSITVGWNKPVNDGGLAVTCYLLEISTKPPVITVSTHTVITRLKANTQYLVSVYAKNAAGYGVVSSKVIRTKNIGKPAVPMILYAVLETSSSGSKLSVVLRWEKPDNNDGNITRYTVYVKEVDRQSDWTKHEDIQGPNQLEYRVTGNIVYGKTYMFMVTAWNKYGESVRDEEVAKTVNTTTSKAISTSGVRIFAEEGSKSSFTALGIIISLLVISLGISALQFLYLRKRVQPRSRNKSKSTSSEMSSKKDATGESYENDFELEVNVSSVAALASRARQPVQTAPEYETINQRAEAVNSNEARPSIDASDYQELNMLPNTSIQGPVYEPLRTRPDKSRAQHGGNGQHPYEPLNVRNQNTTYQALHSNESAI